MADKPSNVTANLNGLTISIDAGTGGITELSYAGLGSIIKTTPQRSGILDLGYPIPDFDPLRRAPRFSHGANVEKTDTGIVISWDDLSPSRPFDLAGKVSARVEMRACEDGRSVIMTCSIKNDSDFPVRQVLFPDFLGVQPFAGKHDTVFRTGGTLDRPFESLVSPRGGGFYAASNPCTFERKLGESLTQWMDLGSLMGGVSLFPKRWNTLDASSLWTRYDKDSSYRWSCVDEFRIEKGQTWNSPEWVLTPHASGWAKGIEPYREYVRSKVSRVRPMPKHVREGLGFRSVWTSMGKPADKWEDVVFHFSELPALAKESKAHGLDEMVLWFWSPFFQLPQPPAYEHLGGDKGLAAAIEECKKIGVNVSLFVSWRSLASPSAERHGLTPPPSGGWNYHPEMVPMFNPNYVNAWSTCWPDDNDPKWLADVESSMTRVINELTPSISWDQVFGDLQTRKLYDVWARMRQLASAKDPEATFSGESFRYEMDANYLDYMWCWATYRECRPYTSVFEAPKLDPIVNRDWEFVKFSFMDNLYMNVMISAPDMPNGSDWIANHPEVGAALKQCAKLRKQFLPYFVDGTLIGDCALTETCAGGHVTSYVLPDRVLTIVLNTGEKRALSLAYDLAPWLKSASTSCTEKAYDTNGSVISTRDDAAFSGTLTTVVLPAYDFAIFEHIVR